MGYSRIVSAFMLAYTISNGVCRLPAGSFGHAPRLCPVCRVVVGRSHAACLCAGPFSLGACRFLLGVGEAGNWPAGVRVVSEWFPVKERALASGIFPGIIERRIL